MFKKCIAQCKEKFEVPKNIFDVHKKSSKNFGLIPSNSRKGHIESMSNDCVYIL